MGPYGAAPLRATEPSKPSGSQPYMSRSKQRYPLASSGAGPSSQRSPYVYRSLVEDDPEDDEEYEMSTAIEQRDVTHELHQRPKFEEEGSYVDEKGAVPTNLDGHRDEQIDEIVEQDAYVDAVKPLFPSSPR